MDRRLDEFAGIISEMIGQVSLPIDFIFNLSRFDQLSEDEFSNFLAVSLPFQDSGLQVSVSGLSGRLMAMFESQNDFNCFRLIPLLGGPGLDQPETRPRPRF